MTPKNFGPGVAPDLAIIDGLVYLAFGVVGGCRLVVLTPAGVEVRRFDLPGGFDQSYPRFDGPWLAYRQDQAHGFRATALNVLTGKEWHFAAAGGTFSLAVSQPLAVVAYEFQRPGEPWHIWFGYLVDGTTSETPLPGAPDGLDTIVDGAHITLRKDTRGSVPRIFYPVRAGDLTVGERRDNDGPYGGIGVLLHGDLLRVALEGQNVPDPRPATDGVTYAIACWGASVQLLLGTRADLQRLPVVQTPGAPPIDRQPDSTEEFMEPWKVTVESFDTLIAKGVNFKARVAVGNGVEVEFQKDAKDELHIAVFKDGVQQDRSGAARHVEVKG